jgi:aminoglycoside phosphotransferase (APT) family kinase protein
VGAVLDWELSMWGRPLADLASNIRPCIATYASFPGIAGLVFFGDGGVFAFNKGGTGRVRAVRGGL